MIVEGMKRTKHIPADKRNKVTADSRGYSDETGAECEA